MIVTGNTGRATLLDQMSLEENWWQQFLNGLAGSQPVTTSMAKILLYYIYTFVWDFLVDTF